MTEWFKTDFKGVRYRKHPSRKNGVKFDQYFVITYKLDGKTKTESIGWATEGHKASEAFDKLCELKKNQKTGQGPRTLAEMKDEGDREREQARKKHEAQSRLDVSFKSFFDDTYLPDAKTRWKPETAQKAEQHVRNWIDPVTGSTPMREIGLNHITRIKGNMAADGKSPRMQQYVFRTFAMIWNLALDHGLVNGPCPTKTQSFRLPKVDNERQRYLTQDEEKKLLSEVLKKSKQAHDMTVVSLDAGLRFGEVAHLTWGCVDVAKGIIRILDSKGRDRYVPITDRLKSLFGSMPAGRAGGLVFPNNKGNVQTQIPSSFKRGLADAKLNEGVVNRKMRASYHTLRHTYASRLVQAGVDLYRVQRLLGHSTPIMTARYSKLADGDLKEAVAAMEKAKEQDEAIERSNCKVIKMRKRKVAK